MGGYYRSIPRVDQDSVDCSLITEYFYSINIVIMIDCEHTAFKMLLRNRNRLLLSDISERAAASAIVVCSTALPPGYCLGDWASH